jgi:hypothetical protein
MSESNPSLKPQRKVAVGAASGAAVTVLAWGVGLAGVEVPVEVAGSLIVLVSFIASYFIPNAQE